MKKKKLSLYNHPLDLMAITKMQKKDYKNNNIYSSLQRVMFDMVSIEGSYVVSQMSKQFIDGKKNKDTYVYDDITNISPMSCFPGLMKKDPYSYVKGFKVELDLKGEFISQNKK